MSKSSKSAKPQATTDVTVDQVRSMIAAAVPSAIVLNNDKTLTDIARLLTRWNNDGKRPLYAYCVVTGDKCAMTAKKLFADRVRKFGSVDKLLTRYIGRGAKAKQVTTVNIDGSTSTDKLDPNDPRAHRRFKTVQSNGVVDWFWRDPKFVADNAARRDSLSVDNMSHDQKVSFYRGLVKNTCHRTDLVGASKCLECPFAYLCQAGCRKFKTDRGRVINEPSAKMVKHMVSNPSKYWVPTHEMVTK